jgi:hypothetical protein
MWHFSYFLMLCFSPSPKQDLDSRYLAYEEAIQVRHIFQFFSLMNVIKIGLRVASILV